MGQHTTEAASTEPNELLSGYAASASGGDDGAQPSSWVV
jgi:hypothetical protein